MKKKTDEEFRLEIKEASNGNIIPLETYVNNATPILFRYMDSGLEVRRKPKYVFENLVNKGSVKANNRKSDEDVKKILREYDPDSLYELVTPYAGMKKKHTFRNKVTGEEFVTSIKGFTKGVREPSKTQEKRRAIFVKTTEQFKQDVYKQVGDEYSVLGEYVTSSTKILLRHNLDGNEFLMTPNAFLNGQRDPKCSFKKVVDNDTFVKAIRDMWGDEYSALEEYRGSKEYILMRHNTTGSEFYMKPNVFLSGGTDPNEKTVSVGERNIAKYLTKMGVKYYSQYPVGDTLQRYDFYLPEFNTLIEFDGEQHYHVVDFFGGEKGLETRMKKDAEKSAYAYDNDIVLIRIPYQYKKKIDEFLSPYFDNYNPTMKGNN